MSTEGHAYARDLEALGVEVRSAGAGSRWDPAALIRGCREIAAMRPDVVHTHLKHADLVGALYARRSQVPMVSTLHLIEDARGTLARLKRAAAAQARVRAAARTIAVSDAQRAWYLDLVRVDHRKVVTIRNGIPAPLPTSVAERERVRAELGLPQDGVVATMIGIMREGKGHDLLLEAVERLEPDHGVTFVLAGDGPLRARLEATAAAAGSPVVFAGFRADIDRLLAASDLVVHPSDAEALPTALIHALAAGLPSVACDVGGVAEVVTPETGVLVPKGDGEAVAHAIRELAGDASRRASLGAAARRRFEAEFRIERWGALLRDLYAEVLDEAEAGTGAVSGTAARSTQRRAERVTQWTTKKTKKR